MTCVDDRCIAYWPLSQGSTTPYTLSMPDQSVFQRSVFLVAVNSSPKLQLQPVCSASFSFDDLSKGTVSSFISKFPTTGLSVALRVKGLLPSLVPLPVSHSSSSLSRYQGHRHFLSCHCLSHFPSVAQTQAPSFCHSGTLWPYACTAMDPRPSQFI